MWSLDKGVSKGWVEGQSYNLVMRSGSVQPAAGRADSGLRLTGVGGGGETGVQCHMVGGGQVYRRRGKKGGGGGVRGREERCTDGIKEALR